MRLNKFGAAAVLSAAATAICSAQAGAQTLYPPAKFDRPLSVNHVGRLPITRFFGAPQATAAHREEPGGGIPVPGFGAPRAQPGGGILLPQDGFTPAVPGIRRTIVAPVRLEPRHS